MTFTSDSGDFTRLLHEGAPFSEVLRLAAARAQARGACEADYERVDKTPDATTEAPKRRKR